MAQNTSWWEGVQHALAACSHTLQNLSAHLQRGPEHKLVGVPAAADSVQAATYQPLRCRLKRPAVAAA